MTHTKPVFFALLFFLFSTIYAFSQEQDSAQVRKVPPAEFYELLLSFENELVIDTRLWKEYRKRRIPNAFSAANGKKLKSLTDSLDRETPLLVYCDYEDRSETVCNLLIQWGFKNVYQLLGGFDAWRRQDLKTDRKRLRRK